MHEDTTTEEWKLEAGLLTAHALGDAGNVLGAVEALRRVLMRFPEHAPAHYLLGLNLFRAGRQAEAESACRAALALDPASTVAHRVAGVVLGARWRSRRQAMIHFRQAVSLAPGDGLSHYYLARALAMRRRRKSALKNYALACRLAPAEPDILAGTAEYFFALRRVREAKALAARAFAAGPTHPMALAAMARSQLYSGYPDEAASLARASIAIDSNYEPALEIVVEATMRRNRIFAVYLALRNWCRAGRMRGFFLIVLYATSLGALLPNLGLPLVVWAVLYHGLLWGALLIRLLFGTLLQRRFRAVLRPVILNKKF